VIRLPKEGRHWRSLLSRALGAPTAFVICHACRISSRKVALALVYHSVAGRDGDSAAELVPPHGVGSFRAQMRLARRCFEIVPASELVPAMTRRPRGGRFPLAVTFDDDLSSHKTAATILRQLGMTGTFFLTGATLGGPSSFWWQLLQACYDRGLGTPAAATAGLDPGGLHDVALAVQLTTRAQRDIVRAHLLELIGGAEAEPGLHADEVRSLVAGGAEIGFHTLHHDYLPNVPDEALDAAVSEGRDRLESAANRVVATIAYPHGGADARVAAAARRAGFAYGFTGNPAAITLGDDNLLLARIEPPRGEAGRFGMRVVRHLVNGLRR
jgi:peptidoglycan/xylan/chitin deacetylase (PgdA/CDA1 family)